MKLLCEMRYEYVIATEICMLSLLTRGTMGPVMWCTIISGHFKREYSQVTDSEFTECVRGENGKCAKHLGITAAAVMDEVTQRIYKTCDRTGTRGTANYKVYKCTLLILKFLAIRKQIFFFFHHQGTSDPRRLWSLPLRPCVFCLSLKCRQQHKRFSVIFCHLW